MADPNRGSNGVYELGYLLQNLFLNQLRPYRTQHFNSNKISRGELPQQVENMTKLVLIPQYFENVSSDYKVPKLLKRHRTETDLIYELRVKNYLLRMNDRNFEKLGELIDPDDPDQFCFFQLYNEIAEERHNEPKGSSTKCTIF